MKPKGYKYVIEFSRGVPSEVVKDMIRHDGQALVDWTYKEHTEMFGVRYASITVVTLYGDRSSPNMDRWTSFSAGARIVKEEEIY